MLEKYLNLEYRTGILGFKAKDLTSYHGPMFLPNLPWQV